MPRWLQPTVSRGSWRPRTFRPRRRHMASDGLRDDVRVIEGGRVGADVVWVAGKDLRWPVQGGRHDPALPAQWNGWAAWRAFPPCARSRTSSATRTPPAKAIGIATIASSGIMDSRTAG